MPGILTRDFGLLEMDSSSELRFSLGLPGFPEETSFVLIEQEATAPLVFLQSTFSTKLCFLAIPVHHIDPDYQIGMNSDDLRAIGFDGSPQPSIKTEVLCLVLLTAQPDGALTANLLAPVVMNLATRGSVQAVRTDSRYSHQQPVGTPETAPCL